MDTKNMDIIYCLKNTPNNEEFRYSLRSLVNIPHRNVWVLGGRPDWAINVYHVPFYQNDNKWSNTTGMLATACQMKQISDNFVWFNDDFFVLEKIDKLEYWYDRTLEARAADFANKRNNYTTSRYGNMLLSVANELRRQDRNTLNYALHIPIVFNKTRFHYMCKMYPGAVHGRSLYCNEFNVGGIEHDDVKVYDLRHGIPKKVPFVSTDDRSFAQGKVGEQIRALFPKACKYEYSTGAYSGLSASPGFHMPR